MPLSIGRRHFTRILITGAAASLFAPVLAAEPSTKLFAFVGETETIVAALTKEDAVLGDDAGAIGKALRERGAMTVWRYAVRKAKDGELEQAPLAKISVTAQGILRVEPYHTPLRLVPLDPSQASLGACDNCEAPLALLRS